MASPERQFLFLLAETLGRTLDEMADMTLAEFHEWSAYFRWKAERQKGSRHG